MALHSHAQSSSSGADELGAHDLGADFSQNDSPIPVSPLLDMSSVKTSSPRNIAPRAQPRPFGLQDCPVFYPTIEEFKDPMAYVRSISEEAQKYGICKIIPPEDWKMPFVTDTEVCRAIYCNHCHSHELSLDFPLQNSSSATQLY